MSCAIESRHLRILCLFAALFLGLIVIFNGSKLQTIFGQTTSRDGRYNSTINYEEALKKVRRQKCVTS